MLDKKCPKCNDDDFIAIYDNSELIEHSCLNCGYEKKISEVQK